MQDKELAEWRPKNWLKIRTEWSDKNLGKHPTPTECFEAGASAMLKAKAEKGGK